MKIVAFILMSTWVAFGQPGYNEICGNAIDSYSGNGGGAPNLGTPVREGREYGNLGASRIAAKFPSVYVENYLHAENISCQKYTFTPQFHFACTFNQYGGHSNQYGLFLGSKSGYGTVYPSDMRFGADKTYPHLTAKWFHSRSCNVFYENRTTSAKTNISYWSPAFKGLHTMLGYVSLSWDVSIVGQPATDFWNRWVTLDQSIWNAYSESEATYGYRQLSGVTGIEVGCLSARRPDGGNYCDLSYGSESSSVATDGANYYVKKSFGSPRYQ